MDRDKQPGISFDGVILVEDNFWRDPEVPDGSNINFGIEVTDGGTGLNRSVDVKATLKLENNDKEVLSMECRFVGFFSTVEGEENMDIEEFVKYNALALIFPYIREHISSITVKSGINPILLPPLNVYSMYDK